MQWRRDGNNGELLTFITENITGVYRRGDHVFLPGILMSCEGKPRGSSSSQGLSLALGALNELAYPADP